MDNLSYGYKDPLNNNKLDNVRDGVSDSNYPNDIDFQDVDNYDYDNIGNLIKDTKGSINNIQWTVYGKIKSITKSDILIEYGYDAAGNRISKTVGNRTTYYVRDATGNVMAIYQQKDDGAWTWKEQDLYGSSRLGMWKPEIVMDGNIPVPLDETIIGSRNYELANHLGNVMATITDKKTGVDDGVYDANGVRTSTQPDGNIDYYTAEVVTANDYYPFGMQMPGRSYSNGSEYRYGFNGKEKDGETAVDDYDFGARIYDGRIGRFLSVDPYYQNFPFYSTYLFAGNSPIRFIDENGGYKIDGAIKSKYPMIYRYLSKNLEKDMLGSSLVAHGFKKLNPKLTNDNLTEIFSNGSGPTIFSDKLPGGFSEATAKYDFEENRSISINEKIFSYVEGVLKNKKSTKEEKTRALTFLKIVVTHETGHDAEKMYGGIKADGTPKMAGTKDEQKKLKDELNIGEAGYELTEYIYGLPAFKNIKNSDKKDLVPNIRGGNDGNKVEIIDAVIKKANGSEEGKKILPTVPN